MNPPPVPSTSSQAASLPPRPGGAAPPAPSSTAAAATAAARPSTASASPSPAPASASPWPGFQHTLQAKTVRPDATTRAHELAREPKLGWVASPSDTQLFICAVAGCQMLYPTQPKLTAHQSAAHAPTVPRQSTTWFDPAAAKADEARARAAEVERMREAARRSFMPL